MRVRPSSRTVKPAVKSVVKPAKITAKPATRARRPGTGRPPGRPPGRKQDERLLLRLKADLLERVRTAAVEDETTVSEFVRAAIGARLRFRTTRRNAGDEQA